MTTTSALPMVQVAGLRESKSAPEQSQRTFNLGISELALIVGVGLLIASLLAKWLSANASPDVLQVCEVVAAMVVAAPVMWRAIRGVFLPDGESHSDQLIALAIAGSIASGELITAVLIPVILELGHQLEENGLQGVQLALRGLKKLAASTATIAIADKELVVPTAEVAVGDVLILRPGDVIAADGEVLRGNATVDESPITGESFPKDIGVGGQLLAGAICLDGYCHLRVQRTGDATAVGKIAELFADAAASKPRIMRTLERYAGFYVPLVVSLSLLTFFYSGSVERAISVLIVACPCAMVLAAPSAMIAALAVATRKGILIKNTKFIESLGEVRVVMFDKTGTVTEGALSVVAVVAGEQAQEAEVRKLAAICAASSKHPVSLAIQREFSAWGVSTELPAGIVREVAGQGVECDWGGASIRLGKPRWISSHGVPLPTEPAHDGPLVAVAKGDRFVGFVLLTDAIRPEAKSCIEHLRTLGVAKIVLLTGDRERVAVGVGNQLGIDLVLADQLPSDKLHQVRTERMQGAGVIVVGDGINDALALAAGDVGIAMGARGAEIAIHSADVALTTNDLTKLPLAIRLSRKARRVIFQNILLGAIAAAGLLLFAAIGTISPLTGAVVHHIGSLLVIANSGWMMRTAMRL